MFNEYTQAANEVTEDIREFSPAAADCIEQIEVQHGTRVAYLAAFVLVQLKRLQSERKCALSQQDIHAFTYCEEMRKNAEAIQLYDAAAGYLLSG